MRRILFVCLVGLSFFSSPALAVNPDEVLSDPALEARAREISSGLRCVVCRGENIDESNASIAHDLRMLVRDRLLQGDSNGEVVDYVVERYGEFVLMKPNRSGANIVLWAAGPVLLLLSLMGGGLYLRRRSSSKYVPEGLSSDEENRLNELMKD